MIFIRLFFLCVLCGSVAQWQISYDLLCEVCEVMVNLVVNKIVATKNTKTHLYKTHMKD